MMKTSEFRTVKFEARTEAVKGKSEKMFLRGYPIVFNAETDGVYDWEYGQIREVISPAALNETDLSNVYLITGHNIEPDKVLGRNGVNMRMEVDDTGLFFECELPDTQHARDIYKLVESGIIDGMSFGFTTSDEVDPKTKTRTINKIDELFEITITPFPAYKEASVIAKENRNNEVVEEAVAQPVEENSTLQTVESENEQTEEKTEEKIDENTENTPAEDVEKIDVEENIEIIQELEDLLKDE